MGPLNATTPLANNTMNSKWANNNKFITVK